MTAAAIGRALLPMAYACIRLRRHWLPAAKFHFSQFEQ
jgi:hypothetical protein